MWGGPPPRRNIIFDKHERMRVVGGHRPKINDSLGQIDRPCSHSIFLPTAKRLQGGGGGSDGCRSRSWEESIRRSLEDRSETLPERKVDRIDPSTLLISIFFPLPPFFPKWIVVDVDVTWRSIYFWSIRNCERNRFNKNCEETITICW